MLRRNDVVIDKSDDSYKFYGRIWRRIDKDHVQVVMGGHYVRIYRDCDLEKVDYKGDWKWQHYPGNDYGNPVRYNFYPNLRKLKKYNQKYFAGFGGFSWWKMRRWTKEEIAEALADRTVFNI